MVLNAYFQQGARSEQNLVQDLINEQLKMYGVEVHYLPRKYVSEKLLLGKLFVRNLMMHIHWRHMLIRMMDMVTIQ